MILEIVPLYSHTFYSTLLIIKDVDFSKRGELEGTLKDEFKGMLQNIMEEELQDGMKEELQDGMKEELQDGMKEELQNGMKEELQNGMKEALSKGNVSPPNWHNNDIKGGSYKSSYNYDYVNNKKDFYADIKDKNIYILINCGWDDNFRVDDIANVLRVCEYLDILLITNHSLSYVGCLPVVFTELMKRKRKIPILCHEYIKSYSKYVLLSYLKCVKNCTFFKSFSENEYMNIINDLYEDIKSLEYKEYYIFKKVICKRKNITCILPLYFLNNGDNIGSSAIVMKLFNSKIVYSINFNMADYSFIEQSDVIKQSNVFTYISNFHYTNKSFSKMMELKNILNIVNNTVNNLGCIFFPVDIDSIFIDLLFHVNALLDICPQRYALLFLCPYAENFARLLCTSLTYMNEHIKNNFHRNRVNIFKIKNLICLRNYGDFKKYEDGYYILFSFPSSLNNNVAKRILSSFLTREKNVLIFTKRNYISTFSNDICNYFYYNKGKSYKENFNFTFMQNVKMDDNMLYEIYLKEKSNIEKDMLQKSKEEKKKKKKKVGKKKQLNFIFESHEEMLYLKRENIIIEKENKLKGNSCRKVKTNAFGSYKSEYNETVPVKRENCKEEFDYGLSDKKLNQVNPSLGGEEAERGMKKKEKHDCDDEDCVEGDEDSGEGDEDRREGDEDHDDSDDEDYDDSDDEDYNDSDDEDYDDSDDEDCDDSDDEDCDDDDGKASSRSNGINYGVNDDSIGDQGRDPIEREPFEIEEHDRDKPLNKGKEKNAHANYKYSDEFFTYVEQMEKESRHKIKGEDNEICSKEENKYTNDSVNNALENIHDGVAYTNGENYKGDVLKKDKKHNNEHLNTFNKLQENENSEENNNSYYPHLKRFHKITNNINKGNQKKVRIKAENSDSDNYRHVDTMQMDHREGYMSNYYVGENELSALVKNEETCSYEELANFHKDGKATYGDKREQGDKENIEGNLGNMFCWEKKKKYNYQKGNISEYYKFSEKKSKKKGQESKEVNRLSRVYTNRQKENDDILGNKTSLWKEMLIDYLKVIPTISQEQQVSISIKCSIKTFDMQNVANQNILKTIIHLIKPRHFVVLPSCNSFFSFHLEMLLHSSGIINDRTKIYSFYSPSFSDNLSTKYIFYRRYFTQNAETVDSVNLHLNMEYENVYIRSIYNLINATTVTSVTTAAASGGDNDVSRASGNFQVFKIRANVDGRKNEKSPRSSNKGRKRFINEHSTFWSEYNDADYALSLVYNGENKAEIEGNDKMEIGKKDREKEEAPSNEVEEYAKKENSDERNFLNYYMDHEENKEENADVEQAIDLSDASFSSSDDENTLCEEANNDNKLNGSLYIGDVNMQTLCAAVNNVFHRCLNFTNGNQIIVDGKTSVTKEEGRADGTSDEGPQPKNNIVWKIESSLDPSFYLLRNVLKDMYNNVSI
ncbi:conserved Plasmodium protein, unknown function [Plasmodium ovale curtisi]|uniref:Cleavage and polyadenylation specificity factor subunit 2 n=1 Tax=Plasmodium ovale curtisi TaxID=864141 RepID=A0A1A8VT61_PLAOA|nr:conserved Plasmodium protein, unknown function [Plasmodium ovale curtisi]